MKKYQHALQKHLSEYAKNRLGVYERGTYKGRAYSHILPSRLRFLNLLEGIRSEFQDYLRSKPAIKLHQYFHHLNSSQALAFNLFYPYFATSENSARSLSLALGFDTRVLSWEFEHIPDAIEGTNTDVMWRVSERACVFCEVKLSEVKFGTAKNDEKHRHKLLKMYRQRLEPLVSQNLLIEKSFFENYQLLRNISLLAENIEHQLVILFPKENEGLEPPLRTLLAGVNPMVRERIKVIYLEDCLSRLQGGQSISEKLRVHAENLAEKYIPPAA